MSAFKSALGPNLLSVQDVKLGRFVVNREVPQLFCFDPHLPLTDRISTAPKIDLERTINEPQKVGIGTAIRPFINGAANASMHLESSLVANSGTINRLQNVQTWFSEALKLSETKTWFEEAIQNGDDIFLVEGIETVVDAKLKQNYGSSRDIDASISVPLDTALEATTGMVVPPNLGSEIRPEIHAAASTARTMDNKATAPGERISAVLYRQVKFKWYTLRQVKTISGLDKNSYWTVHLEFKGPKHDINNVVVPYLLDDIDELRL